MFYEVNLEKISLNLTLSSKLHKVNEAKSRQSSGWKLFFWPFFISFYQNKLHGDWVQHLRNKRFRKNSLQKLSMRATVCKQISLRGIGCMIRTQIWNTENLLTFSFTTGAWKISWKKINLAGNYMTQWGRLTMSDRIDVDKRSFGHYINLMCRLRFHHRINAFSSPVIAQIKKGHLRYLSLSFSFTAFKSLFKWKLDTIALEKKGLENAFIRWWNRNLRIKFI